ncbi:ABC transporter permease [Crassaminicella profunda]|uniref:ABC transporter permease n=1 Tax=Crassaminicella profunda TaxID=1286698 RepID=UPI001CA688DC|nr:iron ABC transporter permease [Crassaminicella profunda]QZY55369.1 iron ABC transporter permease [Crassaminicella profunda]
MDSEKSCKESSYFMKSVFIKLRSESQTVILFMIGILISLFVLYPFLVLLIKSLMNEGRITLDVYIRILKDQETYKAIGNTIYVSLGVTLLTSLFGGTLAWLVTRTDYVYKEAIKKLAFLTFMMPSYVIAISWIEFFGRNGYWNRILRNIFGIYEYRFIPYSLEAVILVMSIHLYPLVFMAIANALGKTDPSLEDAAVMSGASRLKAVITITLPLTIPSFIAIGLLVFSRTMANFGVAAVLALPVGEEVLTTRIYSGLTNLDLQLAIAISVILVIFSGIVFFMNNVLMRKRRFTTMTANAQKAKLIPLGKWKNSIVFFVILFQSITTIIPLIVIVTSSFLKRWGLTLTLDHLTLNNYVVLLFKNQLTRGAFKNSIFYGCIGASIAAGVGGVVSYISNKTDLNGRKLVEFIVTWPMAFPNMVLAVAATLAWMHPPFKLYGTRWIIIVTYIALFLPIIIKNVSGLIQNQDVFIEKAGRMCGASNIRVFKDITLPMIMPGLRSGWILAFLIALREIPISLLLYSPGTETIGVMLFGLKSNSYGLEMTSTLAVVIIGMTIIGHVLLKKVKGLKMEVEK